MSDIQILTIALAIVVPAELVIYSNSRVTGVKEVLRAEMHGQIAELRLVVERNHTELMLKLAEMDGRLTRIENERRIVPAIQPMKLAIATANSPMWPACWQSAGRPGVCTACSQVEASLKNGRTTGLRQGNRA
jgi:hypothetical protein